ncbi:Oxysterol-binding protein-related protein 1D [Platanthera zijinensis]|uniref:Oxysterol-binding protein-related protein 1D n=1 Tax=Platanthera zijinensis TaxID=2320716 RepID=A0AAP0B8W2_9ASPA
MNPLCCIAPVVSAKAPAGKPAVYSDHPARNSLSKVSVAAGTFDLGSNSGGDEVAGLTAEGRDSGGGGGGGNVKAAGILYKWVNYGKGWRPRWFVLQDGVFSYYKLRGSDKISVGQASEAAGVRVIGEGSFRRKRMEVVAGEGLGDVRQWKPFGEIHLKVASIRCSKSDEKRLSIFTGTKTLHLRCDSREDRSSWIEALLSAKDLFPRFSTNNDLATSLDITISTEKLRSLLLEEGLNETVIKECESIMLCEALKLHNQLRCLQQKHVLLLDALRQLETEKLELETTVIHEMKGREANLGHGNGRSSDFYSVTSDGSATDSDVDVESQGADGETDDDDDDGIYFDTSDFLSSEFLRSASYRSQESKSNGGIGINAKAFYFPNLMQSDDKGVSTIEYPFVKRRDKLPEPKEKEKPIGLWSIIKENIGKDLSGVCLPVYFNEPLSSLQKCFEDLEYSYLVDRALEWGNQGNKLMRILNIAAFAVSGYASTEGRQCKPFNPLLGETYEADYPDKGLRFFSEKVSHHPMVVACHCEGRGWKFWGDSNLKGKFWGRSIQLDPIGILTLQFEDGETYQWSKVTTSIYNIILGKIYCHHYGTMRIKGSGQYSCKLKFKEQSIIDRSPHQVHGFVQDNITGNKVAMLLGRWDEAMYYILGDPGNKPKGFDPMSEAVLLFDRDKTITQTRYNLTPFAISLNELTLGLLDNLPPTDSRLRPDQRHLENGEYELANIEKLRLEQSQRQARKLQEKGWQPRWFRKDGEDDCYLYAGGYWEAREERKWDGIPNIFGQNAAMQGVE